MKAIRILLVVIALALPAALLGYSLSSGANKASALCTFQHRSWDIQHEQILDDAVPQKPSEAVLRAFPQLRPFYDERNPLYAEQIRSLNKRRDRKLRILGPRPTC